MITEEHKKQYKLQGYYVVDDMVRPELLHDLQAAGVPRVRAERDHLGADLLADLHRRQPASSSAASHARWPCAPR